VPAFYYHSRFYGWASTPWGTPIRYAWYMLPRPCG
jgi:hypothetical protein